MAALRSYGWGQDLRVGEPESCITRGALKGLRLRRWPSKATRCRHAKARPHRARHRGGRSRSSFRKVGRVRRRQAIAVAMAAEAEQEDRQRRSTEILLCACSGIATSLMKRAVRCALDRCRDKPAPRSPALATQHNGSQKRQLGGQQSMDAALKAHALSRARAASWILPWHNASLRDQSNTYRCGVETPDRGGHSRWGHARRVRVTCTKQSGRASLLHTLLKFTRTSPRGACDHNGAVAVHAQSMRASRVLKHPTTQTTQSFLSNDDARSCACHAQPRPATARSHGAGLARLRPLRSEERP